jgi:hypothetical protein
MKIKCWECGREELIVEENDEDIAEVNVNRLCPDCLDSWLKIWEMMYEKSIPN